MFQPDFFGIEDAGIHFFRVQCSGEVGEIDWLHLGGTFCDEFGGEADDAVVTTEENVAMPRFYE